ncbi:hypothetical protein AQ611_03340 [Burkholderia singularis]|nr:hypothetical protein AQ611_03340 [Burkholderia sp. Bp7605]
MTKMQRRARCRRFPCSGALGATGVSDASRAWIAVSRQSARYERFDGAPAFGARAAAGRLTGRLAAQRLQARAQAPALVTGAAR